MGTFRRLKATFTTSFDQLVSQVENQEAVVDSVIEELQDAISTLKVQAKNLEREISRNKSAIKECSSSASIWRNRAKEVIDLDTEKSKECLARALRLEDQFDGLSLNIKNCEKSLINLSSEQSKLEESLRQAITKKNELLTREQRVKISNNSSSKTGNIEQALNRWEDKLIRQEGRLCSDQEDFLDEYFSSSEYSKRIDQELEKLRK